MSTDKKAFDKAEHKKKKQFAKRMAGNDNWTQVANIRSAIQQLCQIAATVASQINSHELMAQVDDEPTLVANIQIIARDLVKFQLTINTIGSKHHNRTGTPTCERDYMLSLECMEDYVRLLKEIEANQTPLVTHVGEIFEQAQRKLYATNKDALQNINDGLKADIKAKSGLDMDQLEQAIKDTDAERLAAMGVTGIAAPSQELATVH